MKYFPFNTSPAVTEVRASERAIIFYDSSFGHRNTNIVKARGARGARGACGALGIS